MHTIISDDEQNSPTGLHYCETNLVLCSDSGLICGDKSVFPIGLVSSPAPHLACRPCSAVPFTNGGSVGSTADKLRMDRTRDERTSRRESV